VLGLRLVGTKVDKLADFPPKLRTLLEHMIVSHHGELEFGSPKVPIFAEALLLHHLDNMDSKMDALRGALKRDQHIEGEFTGWIAPLERILLKKEKYLQDKPASAAAPASVVAPEPERKAEMEQPESASSTPAPAAPAPVHEPQKNGPHAPPANTLFGDKLRAVLGPHN
jgi:3'-5' exoribonuclease